MKPSEIKQIQENAARFNADVLVWEITMGLRTHFVDGRKVCPFTIVIRDANCYNNKEVIEKVISHFTNEGWVISYDGGIRTYKLDFPPQEESISTPDVQMFSGVLADMDITLTKEEYERVLSALLLEIDSAYSQEVWEEHRETYLMLKEKEA